MTIDNSLPPGYNRFRDAILIVDPGACNPSGVALAIHNACRSVIAENGNQRTDPAIRLMVTQLAFLVNGNSDLDYNEYSQLLDACREGSKKPVEIHKPSPSTSTPNPSTPTPSSMPAHDKKPEISPAL